MQLNNIQFDEPIDSSQYYSSVEEWVTEGISEFLHMMRMVEPQDIRDFDTHSAQIGAMRECADLITSTRTETKPNINALLSWYQYALMNFVSTTFTNVPDRLIPDAVEKGEEVGYIEKVVIDVLSRHGGVGWVNPNLESA